MKDLINKNLLFKIVLLIITLSYVNSNSTINNQLADEVIENTLDLHKPLYLNFNKNLLNFERSNQEGLILSIFNEDFDKLTNTKDNILFFIKIYKESSNITVFSKEGNLKNINDRIFKIFDNENTENNSNHKELYKLSIDLNEESININKNNSFIGVLLTNTVKDKYTQEEIQTIMLDNNQNLTVYFKSEESYYSKIRLYIDFYSNTYIYNMINSSIKVYTNGLIVSLISIDHNNKSKIEDTFEIKDIDKNNNNNNIYQINNNYNIDENNIDMYRNKKYLLELEFNQSEDNSSIKYFSIYNKNNKPFYNLNDYYNINFLKTNNTYANIYSEINYDKASGAMDIKNFNYNYCSCAEFLNKEEELNKLDFDLINCNDFENYNNDYLYFENNNFFFIRPEGNISNYVLLKLFFITSDEDNNNLLSIQYNRFDRIKFKDKVANKITVRNDIPSVLYLAGLDSRELILNNNEVYLYVPTIDDDNNNNNNEQPLLEYYVSYNPPSIINTTSEFPNKYLLNKKENGFLANISVDFNEIIFKNRFFISIYNKSNSNKEISLQLHNSNSKDFKKTKYEYFNFNSNNVNIFPFYLVQNQEIIIRTYIKSIKKQNPNFAFIIKNINKSNSLTSKVLISNNIENFFDTKDFKEIKSLNNQNFYSTEINSNSYISLMIKCNDSFCNNEIHFDYVNKLLNNNNDNDNQIYNKNSNILLIEKSKVLNYKIDVNLNNKNFITKRIVAYFINFVKDSKFKIFSVNNNNLFNANIENNKDISYIIDKSNFQFSININVGNFNDINENMYVLINYQDYILNEDNDNFTKQTSKTIYINKKSDTKLPKDIAIKVLNNNDSNQSYLFNISSINGLFKNGNIFLLNSSYVMNNALYLNKKEVDSSILLGSSYTFEFTVNSGDEAILVYSSDFDNLNNENYGLKYSIKRNIIEEMDKNLLNTIVFNANNVSNISIKKPSDYQNILINIYKNEYSGPECLIYSQVDSIQQKTHYLIKRQPAISNIYLIDNKIHDNNNNNSNNYLDISIYCTNIISSYLYLNYEYITNKNKYILDELNNTPIITNIKREVNLKKNIIKFTINFNKKENKYLPSSVNSNISYYLLNNVFEEDVIDFLNNYDNGDNYQLIENNIWSIESEINDQKDTFWFYAFDSVSKRATRYKKTVLINSKKDSDIDNKDNNKSVKSNVILTTIIILASIIFVFAILFAVKLVLNRRKNRDLNTINSNLI